MNDVIPLRCPKSPPHPRIVALLEEALAHAKAGGLVGIAFATVTDEGAVNYAALKPASDRKYALAGALSELVTKIAMPTDG